MLLLLSDYDRGKILSNLAPPKTLKRTSPAVRHLLKLKSSAPLYMKNICMRMLAWNLNYLSQATLFYCLLLVNFKKAYTRIVNQSTVEGWFYRYSSVSKIGALLWVNEFIVVFM